MAPAFRRLALALLVAPLLAPSALAETPTCASITTAGPTPIGPYVEPEPQAVLVRVWAETNLLDGLQRVECLGADGALVAPDRDMGEWGIEPGGQPVCVPRVGCVWI